MQQSLVLVLVAFAVINSGSSVPVLNNTSANIGIFANDLRSVIREELVNAGLGESRDANVNINVDAGEILRLKYLGQEWKYAAWSCKEIADKKPNYTSGYYWVSPRENYATLLYCDLEREFSIGTRGWHRVANWNMDHQTQCPRNFRLVTSPRRLCGKTTDGNGCNSVYYYSRTQIKRVCGQAIGHDHKTGDGFFNHHCGRACAIDDPYLDGISVTFNNRPRQHVWTFASHCPTPPPPFVGSNFFCGNHGVIWQGRWFCVELPEPTTNNLEVRLCSDENLGNEDILVQLLELYVQ